MQPADGFYVEWVEDEAVVLNPDTGELHYLNAPAALTYALIVELGFEDGLAELRKRVEGVESLDEDLQAILEDMAEKGLLISDD